MDHYQQCPDVNITTLMTDDGTEIKQCNEKLLVPCDDAQVCILVCVTSVYPGLSAKFKVWMTIVESGWNVWVWLVGVVSRRRVWLVGVGGIYGVATGCGCKEVYRFPHTTYPYSSCICSFLQQLPTFCSFLNSFIPC